MAKSILWPLAFALLGACSAPAGNQQTPVPAEAEAAPAKPFIPLPAAEIRKRLPGHYIEAGPYSCFNGPLLILADGRFDVMLEWGGSQGEYVVTDGKIAFDDHGAPEHFAVAIQLFRDQRDRLYYRYDGDTADPRPAVLKPADPAIFKELCREGMPSNAN